MAWTTPRVWSVAELLTAAHMNTYISDNLNYLFSAISAHFMINMMGTWPNIANGPSYAGRINLASNVIVINPVSYVNGSKTVAQVDHPLPSDYGGGTFTAQFYWTANSTSANAVVWGIAGRAYADNDALDQAEGGAQEVTDNNGSAVYTMRISPVTSAITLSGTPLANQMAQWKIYRLGSGADNLAVAALLLAVRISYTRT